MNLKFVSLIISIAVSILLAILVYKNNPKSATNFIFALLGGVTAVWLVVYYLPLFPIFFDLSLLLIRLSVFLAVPQVFLFFLLANTLPKESLQPKKKLLFAIGAWSAFVMLVTISPYTFTEVKIINNSPHPTPGPALPLFSVTAVFFSVVAIYTLMRRSKKSFGREKEQLRYVMFGILLMLGLIISTILIPVALFRTNIFVPFAPLYTLIFLSFTAYAIIRHRLFDIRLVVARAVAYTLLVGVIGLVYTGTILFATTLFFQTAVNIQQIVLYGLLTLTVAFTFQPLRSVFENLTDRFLYKDRYDSSELLANLTRIMASTLRLDELTHGILEQLVEKIKISKVAFILMEGKKIYDVKSEGYDSPPEFSEDDIFKISSQGRILVFEELDEGEIREVLRRLDLEVSSPLITESETIGILICGSKESGEIYSAVDLKVFEILAPEAAVAIQNAKAYEEIKRFSVTLQEEVTKATHNLRIANEKLKELDKLKDEFVSLASHELRTPMTVIKSYLWMLLSGRGGELADKQKQYASIAYSSTDRLIKLVNDMLNVSRIESGRLTLEPKAIDIAQLVADVVIEVKPRAEELGIEISQKAPAKLAQVLGDQDKIKEVLLNLIGNSLKFTPSGGKVTVSLRQKNGFVETEVSDTGRGIAKDDLSKLFQKFGLIDGTYQAVKQDSKGTGLGLYISRSIVELHGGKIWADSSGVGKGAKFTFTLKVFNKADLEKFEKEKEGKPQIGIIHSPV